MEARSGACEGSAYPLCSLVPKPSLRLIFVEKGLGGHTLLCAGATPSFLVGVGGLFLTWLGESHVVPLGLTDPKLAKHTEGEQKFS